MAVGYTCSERATSRRLKLASSDESINCRAAATILSSVSARSLGRPEGRFLRARDAIPLTFRCSLDFERPKHSTSSRGRLRRRLWPVVKAGIEGQQEVLQVTQRG